MEKRLYHILTPVPPEELRNVNCLLVGAISIPQCVFKSQVSATPGDSPGGSQRAHGNRLSCGNSHFVGEAERGKWRVQAASEAQGHEWPSLVAQSPMVGPLSQK